MIREPVIDLKLTRENSHFFADFCYDWVIKHTYIQIIFWFQENLYFSPRVTFIKKRRANTIRFYLFYLHCTYRTLQTKYGYLNFSCFEAAQHQTKVNRLAFCITFLQPINIVSNCSLFHFILKLQIILLFLLAILSNLKYAPL